MKPVAKSEEERQPLIDGSDLFPRNFTEHAPDSELHSRPSTEPSPGTHRTGSFQFQAEETFFSSHISHLFSPTNQQLGRSSHRNRCVSLLQ
jgi:hypothetical protein